MCDVLVCEVRNITFYNEATSYLVAKVLAQGEPGLVTIVGNMGAITPGEVLSLSGQWRNHPQYGRQFCVETFEQRLPASLSGIQRYLESRQIKGIGPVLAGRMIKAFGDKVLQVLDEDPERLLKVKGISPGKLEQISQSWNAQREVRGLLLFLQTHKVPTTFANKIFKHYGAGAEEALKNNPYGLAYDIQGIGFKTADAMAMKLGFDPHCQERLEAAIVYMLFTLSDQGHLFYPAGDLLARVHDMLGGVQGQALEEALEGLAQQKRVRLEDLSDQGIPQAVYLWHYYKWEKETADRLLALASHPAPVNAGRVEPLLPGIERESGLKLSDEQRQAVISASSARSSSSPAAQARGKTTITR